MFALLPSKDVIINFQGIGYIVDLNHDASSMGKDRTHLMSFVERCLFKAEDPEMVIPKGPLNFNGISLTLD